MSEEWGPWIKHDGAQPTDLPRGARVDLRIDIGTGRIYLRSGDRFDGTYPGFFWRMKPIKAGWFRYKFRRVCDDQAYCPIVEYRIRKPRGLTILEGLLENLPEEVDA